MTDIANAMTTVGSNAANARVQVNELSALIGTAVATTKKEGNELLLSPYLLTYRILLLVKFKQP